MSEKTTVDHWDGAWSKRPRPRLPKGFDVGTRNVQRLLRRHVKPGMNFLEIGCAPGKMMSWVNKILGANISGIDYSPRGAGVAKWLLDTMGIAADIRCESIFETTFSPESFDVVYSYGLIEHFDDPRDIVAAHVNLLRKGGVALIIIPNYGGIYGKLQQWFDPGNLLIHNLDIMNEAALRRLAPPVVPAKIKTYSAGCFSPWQVSWARRWGRIGSVFAMALNAVALLQPVEMRALCPLLVLEIYRTA